MQSFATGQVKRSSRPASRPVAQKPVGESLEPRRLLSGLAATYYNNADFTGTSLTRIDPTVNFSWSNGSPDPAIGSDTFSARWTGQVRAKYSERYTFSVSTTDSGDKARVWVNGQLLADTWDQNVSSGAIDLEMGRLYDIKVEFRDDSGTAGIKVRWQSKSQGLTTITTDVLYPPSTPTTAATTSAVYATIDARTFGAIGNGVVDDSKAIQNAIDSVPAFGTLRLEPRTYKLNTSLVIDKPMNLEGNGALLLLNTSVSPQNKHLVITSRLSTNSTTWSENIVGGQSTFHPTFAPGTFSVGQWVVVEMGHDPYDINEQHFTSVAPVTAVGTNSVTLGLQTPYDIINGGWAHKITALDTLATQVHVRDLKFDHVNGQVPDAAIWVAFARNSSFDGISGRFNDVLNVSDSANIVAKNITATLVNGHSAAGRVLTAWQSNNVQVSGVQADTSSDKAVFLLEGGARNTSINDVAIRWRNTESPRNAVFHLTGGSSGTVIDNVSIDNNGPIILAGGGGQPADYLFGTVSVRNGIKSAPLLFTNDLTVGTQRYRQPVRVVKTIDLASGWVDKSFEIAGGAIKSLKLTLSHAGALTGGFLVNSQGKGMWFADSLVVGKAVDLSGIVGMLGSDYPLNEVGLVSKRLQLYTAAKVPAGARLTVDIEYYPPSS